MAVWIESTTTTAGGLLRGLLDDAPDLVLREDPDPLPGRTGQQPQPAGTQVDLRRGLLSRGIERAALGCPTR